jgi:predicted alpha/beta-fold hydrolase
VTLQLDDSFRPPRWLRNCHVQSILPSVRIRRTWVMPRAKRILAVSQELLLDCGDGVRLQAFYSSPVREGEPPARNLAVLLHGWEGASDSLYILSLAQQLFDRGFDIVRLNLRDHGGTHHLNRDLFHSCLLPEVIGAVKRVQEMHRGKLLHLVGFSLGGNFMLRVAAEAGNANLDLAKAIAVSPVLDPAETLGALERGFTAYHTYFIRKWTRSLLLKQAAWPGHYDFSVLQQMNGLRHMTAEMVRRFTGFGSLEDYLAGYAITGTRLARLEVPATLITSLDDPIIPSSGLAKLARPTLLRVIVTRLGGHCGFLEHFSAPTWAERKVVQELTRERAEEPGRLRYAT